MSKRREPVQASHILYRRYVGANPERRVAIESERVNSEIARLIIDLRTQAGLRQRELAELVGTTQSVISRLEDSDYSGHSLSMLHRIAKALNQKLQFSVVLSADDDSDETLRYVFQVFLQGLRRSRGLSVKDLARRTDIHQNEILAIERHDGYRPAPLTRGASHYCREERT